MAARLYLVTGGARSGKSAFAHELALRLGQKRLFVATAQAFDPEMRERIERHQSERGAAYRTLEEPRDLSSRLAEVEPFDVILIDCLTLWLSNLLLADTRPEAIEEAVLAGVAAARLKAKHVILVSNEVGFGIVPPHPLGRLFRDLNGRLQQLLAAKADALYLAVMGRVLPLHQLGLTAHEVPL